MGWCSRSGSKSRIRVPFFRVGSGFFRLKFRVFGYPTTPLNWCIFFYVKSIQFTTYLKSESSEFFWKAGKFENVWLTISKGFEFSWTVLGGSWTTIGWFLVLRLLFFLAGLLLFVVGLDLKFSSFSLLFSIVSSILNMPKRLWDKTKIFYYGNTWSIRYFLACFRVWFQIKI